MTEQNESSKLTKEEINNIWDNEKRVEAIQDNMHLYDGSTEDKQEYKSKEDINKIKDPVKRLQAIEENMNLFN